MMKKTAVLALVAVGVIASCSDETTVYSDPQKEIELEGNEKLLQESIIYDNSGVLDIYEENQAAGKSLADELAGDYPLTLVAQVSPPSYTSGDNLTASHVHLDGNYAYVSYNTVDAVYAGALDIIDISDPHTPQVRSRLYYVNADINSLKYSNGYVYAVGGVDAEKSVTATANSFVAKIPVFGGRFDTGSITYGFQEGFNATDVAVSSNSLLVTSGKDGFLTSYAIGDLTIEREAAFADLRAVAVENGTIAVLDGSQGVSLMDSDLNVSREITINTDFGASSKRTLDISGNTIVVAEGSKGAGIYDASTGSLEQYVPIMVNPQGVAQSDIVTNAVAINENVVLMANGGAGLSLSEDQSGTKETVGVIELDGSINYVESKGDYIFAASGKKGLQIIKLNRPDASLVSRCANLESYVYSSTLVVNQGEVQEFQGAKRFQSIDVNGSLLLCGSWTVRENATVGEGALFEMNGTFVVGRNSRTRDVVVADNATFRVEGNLTIYGDLILGEGATLEFIGTASVANIFGTVSKGATSVVEGDFLDLQNKF